MVLAHFCLLELLARDCEDALCPKMLQDIQLG